MENQLIPISLNLLAAILGAVGQYFYKKGGVQISQGGVFFNLYTILGMILFTLVMVCFVIGYKFGGKISVVYPFYATTFLWGTLIGVFIEKESFSLYSILGLVFMFIGISLLAISQRTSIG